MDLKSQVIENLDNKVYDDFTKIRWIYLYVCRLFSYDMRFPYASESLKKEIYNKELDIENIEDFEVICYSLAKVLVDTLALYGFESEIVRTDLSKFTHAYVIVKHKDFVIKLDPTKRHDVTRVKMNSTTLDFTSLNEEPNFVERLEESDKIINNNYKDIDTYVMYDNKTIEELVKVIENSAKQRNLTESELFFEKIEYLFSLINTRTDFKRYDDIDYYMAYLIKKFKLNEKRIIVNNEIFTTKINYVKPAMLFNCNDKSMKDIINITFIDYENMPPIFYLLRKEGDSFNVREIYQDEALELLNEYQIPNPYFQNVFKEAAKKLAKSNEKGIII